MAKPKVKPESNISSFHNTGQSLQERLHTLLTRLSDTGEILKKWPEAKTGQEDIHRKSTTKLIASLQKIIHGIQLVEEKANTLGQDAATLLKQMYTWERQRMSAREIKNTLHQFHGGGVTKVEIQHQNDTIQEITTKEEIEQTCIDENKKNSIKQTTHPV